MYTPISEQDIYIKKNVMHPHDEFARSLLLYKRSLLSHKFSSPKPIYFDGDRKLIAFIKLPRGNTLKNITAKVLRNNISTLHKIYFFAGESLADLHSLPFSRGDDATTPCFVHEDFWIGNIWVADSGEIFILDPVPSCTRLRYSHVDLGCQDYDLASFIFSIRLYHPLHVAYKISKELTQSLIDFFLDGYARKMQVHGALIGKCLNDTFNCYMEHVQNSKMALHRRLRINLAQKSFDMANGVLNERLSR